MSKRKSKAMMDKFTGPESTEKSAKHRSKARSLSYDISEETAKKVEIWENIGMIFLAVLFVMQLCFVAPKVALDPDNDGVPWAVVFIPAYIFFGLWGLIALGFPFWFSFHHAWYLFSGWMAMTIAWAATLTSFILLVVHLEVPDKPNLGWALYIPLIIIGAYMILFFLWDLRDNVREQNTQIRTRVKDEEFPEMNESEEYLTE